MAVTVAIMASLLACVYDCDVTYVVNTDDRNGIQWEEAFSGCGTGYLAEVRSQACYDQLLCQITALDVDVWLGARARCEPGPGTDGGDCGDQEVNVLWCAAAH